MKEQHESKLDELIGEALTVIKNHPQAESVSEKVVQSRHCIKAYWNDEREDGNHHAMLYFYYGNRRADIGSKIRIWVALRDIHILDFVGDRIVPISSGGEDFCIDFNVDLKGEVNGVTEALEAAVRANKEELAQLEAAML